MKMFSHAASLGLAATLAWVGASGCTQAPEAASSSTDAKLSLDGAKYLLSEEPTEAADVIAVREVAQDGDDVVITGRIGGSENPWTQGRAAFSIVDASLQACSDIPGDLCEKPWDYCCATDKLPSSTALVKVVDEHGDLVKADARDLLNVKELSTVVVRGKAQRDEAGNLTVHAVSVYVKE